MFRQEDSRSDIVFLEPIEMVSSAQSLRLWLEDFALCHALAALPDSLDGGSDSGPPREALGCARTWFSGFWFGNNAREENTRTMALQGLVSWHKTADAEHLRWFG